MSESELCDCGNGEEEEEEEDDEEEDKERGEVDGNESELELEVDERQRAAEVQRKGVFGISRDFRNAIKRPFRRKRKKEKERGDSEIIRLSRSRRGSEIGGGGGCYVCFVRPRTDEECPETPTSDPNSESFSFEMLRTLIESNDFCCKECNPHI